MAVAWRMVVYAAAAHASRGGGPAPQASKTEGGPVKHVAGIDIGNTTTEIVIAELRGAAAAPIRHGSVLTPGGKGSPKAVDAAWRLLSRLESAAGVRCDAIVIAAYEPVDTGIRSFIDASPRSSRLVPLDRKSAYTPHGHGLAVGRPVSLAELDSACGGRAGAPPGGPVAASATAGAGPVVATVPAGTDFAEAARSINAAVRRGIDVRGVLVDGDDAVLIGNRLERPLPIVDEADIDKATTAEIVLLEVAPDGQPLRVLADPLALRAALQASLNPGSGSPQRSRRGAQDADVREAGPRDLDLREIDLASRDYVDARCGAVAYLPQPAEPADGSSGAWVEFFDAEGKLRRSPIIGNLGELSRAILPGSVRGLSLPSRPARSARDRRGGGEAVQAERGGAGYRGEAAVCEAATDFYAPDLPGILALPVVRRGTVVVLEAPAAVLKPGAGREDARALLEEMSGRPVVVVASEARAARRGALTTPGAPGGAAVCDIGGGTIDLIDERAAVTAAGAGELLTLSVGMAAGIPRSTAERVKRYRSFRVESPRLVHDEDGNRRFVGGAEYGRHVGRLCVDSGRGVLPFHDRLSPEEWRILRLTLKEEVLGANVRRALRALGPAPAELVLCGGCALDDELVRVVADSLRDQRVLVGRADVAGRLGPRYAVALGLVLSRADEQG